MIVETEEGIEVKLNWTCPRCNFNQDDYVHPEKGPYISCVCEKCGALFDDETLYALSPEAFESWDNARAKADEILTIFNRED